ncbi:MAG: 5'/3'-nucleotidase SurE [Thermoanaerobaculaceae bacterium]|nr:5'/3'-nucleotidase SurE [Thermoanaerobaculaceae bacterium]MDI9621756.1 5'/3'-nucleotidase SurE [Acidobacteriota bacterium]HPW56005.1 5'/3'-nucleotidase SurE [Thermoanaerobaculaceae bacterium]
MRQPLLLVCNDDGFSSPGIQVLIATLAPVGDVWVVAPDRENSAVSHALTLSRPLRLSEASPQRFVVDGTPTDCIALALGYVLKGRQVDLVVSGINHGANMGDDVHYSGTVSAAFEAAVQGLPAIAISLVAGNGWDFTYAARCARWLAERVLARGMPAGTLLNVNVPPGPPRGVGLTRLGKHRYTEGVIEGTDPRGKKCYWIGGGEPVWQRIPGTDFMAIADGYVSVTPLQRDMTDLSSLEALRNDPGWELEETP